MNRLSVLLLIIICQSCCLYKHLPSETYTNVRDSVNVIIRDSINWIPKERIVDVVPTYDSLKLETSLAKAIAYVDTTTHTLKGSIENKEGVKTKYVYKDRIHYKDSIKIVKEPYPVEKPVKYVPKWAYWTLVITLLVIGYIGFKIYFKFFGR